MEKYRFTDAQRAWMEGMQIPFAVYQFINKRVVTLILSDGFCDLFGYTDRAQAYYDMDNDMYKATHPDDVARIANEAVRFATEGGSYEVIYRTRTKASSAYTIIHAKGEHVVTETGDRLAYVWYTDEGIYAEESASASTALTNSLRSVLREQSALKDAQYDYLTGLPNMTYFFELADAEKDAILNRNGHPVLLYLDFSGMKFFNLKHGFAQGDQILKAFAKLLTETFSNENCCRIGADHFAAITDEFGLEEKLQSIFRTFGALHDAQTPPVHVGIYLHRMGDVSGSAACGRAKLACSALSGTYTSAFRYYSAELRNDAVQKQYILENIDKAIREKWIQVYYQPIIRAVNEQICNAEALARWVDPVQGVLSPAGFIPALEEAGLIYKLDLFVLEQVLEHMQTLQEEGLYIVPHSINLSRSDFDACNIVEEIRRRVDDAGIPRDRITVEITESVIGRDFDFMKTQITRFRELGFPVWMDDFGSGYSSLDVLQSIRFDLLKFDMNFMRKFDEDDNGKIILTELMKMASAMDVETVCEGVETEAHVRFLQEIGCSKLQGYYYGKPHPFRHVLQWYRAHREDGIENPAESDYYASIGRVNLYDLGVIAKEEENSLQNAFKTLPMGIIEIRGDCARFVRSNPSYRGFIRRFFGLDLSSQGSEFAKFDASFLQNVVKNCCEQGMRLFYDEKMPDGSVVHSFARRIGVNPVNGNIAVVVAVLSISDPNEGTSYADIARALAADYHNIYVVDLDTDRRGDLRSGDGAPLRRGRPHGAVDG